MINIVTGGAQPLHDRVAQCRRKAVAQRVGVDDENPHRWCASGRMAAI